jgi:hypothetical protein
VPATELVSLIYRDGEGGLAMAMTKSRYKIEQEEMAARKARRKWLDEWLAAYRVKFAVTLQLTKEMYRWRA